MSIGGTRPLDGLDELDEFDQTDSNYLGSIDLLLQKVEPRRNIMEKCALSRTTLSSRTSFKMMNARV